MHILQCDKQGKPPLPTGGGGTGGTMMAPPAEHPQADEEEGIPEDQVRGVLNAEPLPESFCSETWAL